MKVKVVADAMSCGGYFPRWHNYYGNQFGFENLIIFTYESQENSFNDFEIGNVYPIAEKYEDDRRLSIINRFCSEKLNECDLIVRVDIDEFIVPNPNIYDNLAEYIYKCEKKYVTAYGFDIIQRPDEPPLDAKLSILEQRNYAYALTAMNKTCATRVPITWNRGFHYCSVTPSFDDLFLFHTKRADIGFQQNWNEFMTRSNQESEFLKEYYSWRNAEILDYHGKRFSMEILRGDDAYIRSDFNSEFLKSIYFDDNQKIYNGSYLIEDVNFEIPQIFKSQF